MFTNIKKNLINKIIQKNKDNKLQEKYKDIKINKESKYSYTLRIPINKHIKDFKEFLNYSNINLDGYKYRLIPYSISNKDENIYKINKHGKIIERKNIFIEGDYYFILNDCERGIFNSDINYKGDKESYINCKIFLYKNEDLYRISRPEEIEYSMTYKYTIDKIKEIVEDLNNNELIVLRLYKNLENMNMISAYNKFITENYRLAVSIENTDYYYNLFIYKEMKL